MVGSPHQTGGTFLPDQTERGLLLSHKPICTTIRTPPKKKKKIGWGSYLFKPNSTLGLRQTKLLSIIDLHTIYTKIF
jgi:hypothetical protein